MNNASDFFMDPPKKTRAKARDYITWKNDIACM
jgi:hypothetical protein